MIFEEICSLHFRQWIILPILVSLYEGKKKTLYPYYKILYIYIDVDIDTIAVPERQRLGKGPLHGKSS